MLFNKRYLSVDHIHLLQGLDAHSYTNKDELKQAVKSNIKNGFGFSFSTTFPNGEELELLQIDIEGDKFSLFETRDGLTIVHFVGEFEQPLFENSTTYEDPVLKRERMPAYSSTLSNWAGPYCSRAMGFEL